MIDCLIENAQHVLETYEGFHLAVKHMIYNLWEDKEKLSLEEWD